MGKLKIQFGKRLQALRREAGITQEQLADKIGLTVESISNIERGLFGPKFENLEKIATVLKVPVKTLFEFERGESGKSQS
ncbi:MAG: helix-turn-helix transcriptional regulator [Sulfuricellaceae bacterium]